MKRTPMSTARTVGNRKITFAMIERDRSTNRERTVTCTQRCADDDIDNINNLLIYKNNTTENLQATSTLHVVPIAQPIKGTYHRAKQRVP